MLRYALWTAASRIVCSRIEKAGEVAASVRMVRPTGPRVSVVSIGSATSAPLAMSSATTPAEMIQTASLWRTKARPNESETVSIWVGIVATPLVMKKRSTNGRMTDPRVGISTGKSREPLEHVLALAEQRMAGPHHEQHLLGIEVLEEEAGHLLRRRQPPDHEVEFAEPQLLQQHRILAGHDLDRAAGLLLQEQAHRIGHDARRDRRQGADADRHAAVIAGIGDGIDALPERGDRHAGMAHEDLAGARDLDAAAVALEHRDAERLLEFADRLGHRRLADIQQSGGLDDAFLARNFEEGLEMAKPDAALDHGFP